jgi:hypothetical protein
VPRLRRFGSAVLLRLLTTFADQTALPTGRAPTANLPSELPDSLTCPGSPREALFFQVVYTPVETRSSAKIKTVDNGNRPVRVRIGVRAGAATTTVFDARILKRFEQEVTEATEIEARGTDRHL